MRPSFLIGGDVNEIGTNAVWDDGRVAGGRGRRERRHLPLARRPTSPWSPTSRPTISTTTGPSTPLRSAFERVRGRGRGPAGGAAATTPVAAEHRPGRGADLVGTGRRLHLPDGRRSSRPELGLLRPGRPGGVGAGPAGRPGPRAPQRPQRRRGHGGRPRRRVPASTTPARALARFAGVARRFEFRGAVDGVTFVDDYAHLPSEVRAALAAARNGGLARGSWPCSSPTATAGPRSCGSEFGRGLRRRRRGGGHRRLRGRRGPGARGHRPAGGRRRARRAIPDLPVHYVAGRADLRRRGRRTCSSRATCACTLGAGDLTSLPDELMADAGAGDGAR